MKFKALASPLALMAALALTTTASAQTMVGNQDVSEEDLPYVQEHCDALAANADELPGATPPAEGVEPPTPPAAEPVPAPPETPEEAAPEPAEPSPPPPAQEPVAPPPEGAEEAQLPEENLRQVAVDLEQITLEDCQEAGLVE